MAELKWYAVHTLSGQEMRVKKCLEQLVKERGLEDKIARILVPTETVIEMKQGKKRGVQRKFFPGYVIIEMKLDKETQKIVRDTPGVTGFVSSGNTVTPLADEEIERILARIEGVKFQKKLDIPFKIGDPVKMIDGPFKDFVGVVSDVNKERGKVKVMVSMFGRLTPVEVDFLQLKEDKE